MVTSITIYHSTLWQGKYLYLNTIFVYNLEKYSHDAKMMQAYIKILMKNENVQIKKQQENLQ